MLRINLENRAEKFLKRLPMKQAGQVSRKILALAENPKQTDSRQLSGSVYQRVDIGEYRIVYIVEGPILRIPLIGKRNDDEIYRRLKRLER